MIDEICRNAVKVFLLLFWMRIHLRLQAMYRVTNAPACAQFAIEYYIWQMTCEVAMEGMRGLSRY